MKRRAFIVTLATAPLFIRRAFADASVGGVRAASTRPTLVLVVPREDQRRWERGAAFGDYLNRGSDRDLAPLALVDVVCAPARDFAVEGEPLMLFVSDGKVRVLDGKWPKDDPGRVALIRRLVSEVAPLRGSDAGSLAAAARQRYVKKAPSGARWGRPSMCGAEYEEGPADNVDCGMGHVPDTSRRFLDFYARRS